MKLNIVRPFPIPGQLRLLELRMRFLELRFVLNKTRIICLKRSYLAPNESNLASELRYGRAVLNHPVECINVLQCCHSVRMHIQCAYRRSTPR
jgi:hypothetical protein